MTPPKTRYCRYPFPWLLYFIYRSYTRRLQKKEEDWNKRQMKSRKNVRREMRYWKVKRLLTVSSKKLLSMFFFFLCSIVFRKPKSLWQSLFGFASTSKGKRNRRHRESVLFMFFIIFFFRKRCFVVTVCFVTVIVVTVSDGHRRDGSS